MKIWCESCNGEGYIAHNKEQKRVFTECRGQYATDVKLTPCKECGCAGYVEIEKDVTNIYLVEHFPEFKALLYITPYIDKLNEGETRRLLSWLLYKYNNTYSIE